MKNSKKNLSMFSKETLDSLEMAEILGGDNNTNCSNNGCNTSCTNTCTNQNGCINKKCVENIKCAENTTNCPCASNTISCFDKDCRYDSNCVH